MKCNFKRYINKKLIKVGSLILLIATIGSSIFVYNYSKDKNYAIDLVKNQTSEINPNINFDKAYNKYLTNLCYTYYKDSNKNQFVCVSGKLYQKERNKISDMKLTYLINKNSNSLKFYSLTIDDAAYSEIESLVIKIKAYGSYDSKNV